MVFYLVKRGPRPEYYKAPFHPVIICAKRRVAIWETQGTDRKDWVWEGDAQGGWLLVRWNGFDVDYGNVVHVIEMPDSTNAGFFHDRQKEPWTLLEGAVWWDTKPIPKRLLELGIVPALDKFSLDHIKWVCEITKDRRF